jgi:hypothetical protein
MNDPAAGVIGGLVLSAVFFYLLPAFVCGFFTSWLAQQKGYSGGAWLLLGWLFSILALLTMVGAPTNPMKASSSPYPNDKPREWECPKCQTVNVPDSFVCSNCGLRLR